MKSKSLCSNTISCRSNGARLVANPPLPTSRTTIFDWNFSSSLLDLHSLPWLWSWSFAGSIMEYLSPTLQGITIPPATVQSSPCLTAYTEHVLSQHRHWVEIPYTGRPKHSSDWVIRKRKKWNEYISRTRLAKIVRVTKPAGKSPSGRGELKWTGNKPIAESLHFRIIWNYSYHILFLRATVV